tara:strand:- start:342 stop:446 length:105 start_codon:yes stop_codon:yes gene_type:complete
MPHIGDLQSDNPEYPDVKNGKNSWPEPIDKVIIS